MLNVHMHICMLQSYTNFFNRSCPTITFFALLSLLAKKLCLIISDLQNPLDKNLPQKFFQEIFEGETWVNARFVTNRNQASDIKSDAMIRVEEVRRSSGGLAVPFGCPNFVA